MSQEGKLGKITGPREQSTEVGCSGLALVGANLYSSEAVIKMRGLQLDH